MSKDNQNPPKGSSEPGSATTPVDVQVPENVSDIKGPGSLGAREALGLEDDPRNILDIMRKVPSKEVSYSPNVPPRKKPTQSKEKSDDATATPTDGTEGSGEGSGTPGTDDTGSPGSGVEGGQQGKPGTPAEGAPEGGTPAPTDTEGQPPAAPAPPPPQPPQKVKIGDREYTTEELEAALREKESRPAVPPEPKPTEPPEPEKPRELSEEEKTAIREKEERFIQDTAKEITYTAVSNEDLDVILEGGEPAAKKMTELLANQAAHTILETRRGVYSDVNRYIAELEERLGPVFSQQDQLQRAAVETQFLQTYPEYSGNEHALKAARQVAEQLVSQYPEEIAKMELPDFIKEVDRQTSAFLNSQIKTWNPTFDGTWREFQAPPTPGDAPQPPQPAGTPPPPPPPPPPGMARPAQTPPAAPAAAQTPPAQPAKRRAKAPTANPPASTSMVGDPHAKDWQKQTARSLVD